MISETILPVVSTDQFLSVKKHDNWSIRIRERLKQIFQFY